MTSEHHPTVRRTVSVLLAISIAVAFSGVVAGGALAATGEDVDGETVELDDLDGETVDLADVDATVAKEDPDLVECVVEALTNPYKYHCTVE